MTAPPARLLEPDLCVIGGGTAGHAIALAAGALGLSCCLIDPRERLGVGQAADLADAMMLAASHARDPAGDASTDFAGLRARIGAAIGAASPEYAAERLRALGVTVVRSAGRLVDRDTVATDHASIRARRIVLATGARQPSPSIAGEQPLTVLGTDGLRRLQTMPDRVAVLCDAPRGYAWAQALRAWGATVSVIDRSRDPHPWDAELIETVRAAVRRDGIALHLDCSDAALLSGSGGLRVVRPAGATIDIETAHVLDLSTPVPSIEGLGLDEAGVQCAGGAPVVGSDLRTGNRRIFAIGDVLGAPTSGPAAIPPQVAVVLRAAFFHQPVRFRPGQVPLHLPTRPAVAQVGILEAAPGRGVDGSRLFRWPVAATARAAATGEQAGQIKVRTTAGGQVLGVGIIGAQAHELILPWTLAVAQRLPLTALANLAVDPLSASDLSRRVAVARVAGQLRSPWVKRLLAVLRRFG